MILFFFFSKKYDSDSPVLLPSWFQNVLVTPTGRYTPKLSWLCLSFHAPQSKEPPPIHIHHPPQENREKTSQNWSSSNSFTSTKVSVGPGDLSSSLSDSTRARQASANSTNIGSFMAFSMPCSLSSLESMNVNICRKCGFVRSVLILSESPV